MITKKWKEHLQRFAALGADAFKHMPKKHAVRKFCVIIEPRQHEHLIPVIKNFMCLLQHTGWGLIVYHGPDNERFVKDGLKDVFPDECVHYVRLIKKNLTNGEYSAMVANPLFWETMWKCFNCEHALIFQTDTLLLKGGDAVDSFLKYDYVGAPWANGGMCAMMPPNKRHVQLTVGNGGLSLRNVRAMMAIARRHPYKSGNDMPEDIYFAHWLKVYESDFRVPNADEASAFAMEHVYNPNAAGMHSPLPALESLCDAMISKNIMNIDL